MKEDRVYLQHILDSTSWNVYNVSKPTLPEDVRNFWDHIRSKTLSAEICKRWQSLLSVFPTQ
jgi:hypothetical protein